MGPAAKIKKLALRVPCDGSFIKPFDEFCFVRVVVEALDGIFLILKKEALGFVIFFDDLLDFFFDFFKIFVRDF